MTAAQDLAHSALIDLLFDEPGIGRCLVAPDGTVLRVNSEWLRSTGLELDDALGADLAGLFPDTRDTALALHARARAGHRVEVPRHARRVCGRETWWEGSIAPVPMDDGAGLLVTAREVSGQQPRAGAPESGAARGLDPVRLARLREIADRAPAGVFVKDSGGRYLFVNRWMADILGSRPEDLVGRAASDIFPPAVAEHTLALERRVAEGREIVNEETIPTPRGERALLTVRFPYPLAAGEIGSFAMAIDVTELRRAEREEQRRARELKTVLDTMRTLIENVNVGVALIDEAGRFTQYNRRFLEIFGLSADSTLANVNSHDWQAWQVVDEEGRPLHVDEHPVRTVARTGGAVRDQLVGVRSPSGRDLVWLLVTAEAIPTPEGSQVICTYQDITDRKRAEEALRDADRRKNEFLGMLSHELRNPLAPIRNSVYVLEHAAPASEQAARARAVIDRQSAHLTRLVDDLLDVTRIARGKIDLRRERVDLRELVRRSAEDFRSLLEDRGVALRTLLPDGKPWVHADATRLAQVVGNLLQNAAKFTRRGDEVVVSLRAAGSGTELSVRDTGAGIEAELLPNVFEPFVQGDRTLARSDGGLGLGLALVKGLVELHGGTVRAESAGLGKGTEFVVRLPRAAAATPQVRPAGSARLARGGRRVLVVDDNVDAARSLAEVVEMLGHSAETAYDGPSAIDKAQANPPDVVLCDIGLPGMSGYDVARALRELRAEGVRLVAVTGYAQPEDLRAAVEAGFDRHIAKPPAPDDLARVLV